MCKLINQQPDNKEVAVLVWMSSTIAKKKKQQQEIHGELIFIHFSPLLVKAILTGQ